MFVKPIDIHLAWGLFRVMPSVYLDCNATTPLDPRVRQVLLRYLDEEYGNEGSRTHEYGSAAKRAVQQARDQVASVVDCKREEVLFTSGATESNNLAILGLVDFGIANNRRHIVSTMIEHKAVLEPLADLESRGFEVTYVKPQADGIVRAVDVLSALRPDTLLVTVMHVNNETGVIQPVDEIASGMANHLAFLHVDAAQSFGKIAVTLKNQRIDLISVSGHKIYAPKGIGALITRRRGYEKVPLKPLMFGGGQERGIRPGTLPVALIAALGEAAACPILARAGWRRNFGRRLQRRGRVEAQASQAARGRFRAGIVDAEVAFKLRHERSGGGEFGDEGGEEVRGGGAGGGELRFQGVHQGHQLLHFGHDPSLFGEGWQGNRDKHRSSQSQILVADTVRESLRLVIAVR